MLGLDSRPSHLLGVTSHHEMLRTSNCGEDLNVQPFSCYIRALQKTNQMRLPKDEATIYTMEAFASDLW